MRRSFFKKHYLRLLVLSPIVGLVLVVLNHSYVQRVSSPYLFQDLAEVQHHKVALVLGTSKFVAGGYVNLFYQYRLNAALELYKQGKVDYLLLSGDNGTKEYNEPAMMRADLLAHGVPDDRIYLDYAGFRTLDSVVRAKAIFGQDRLICVSQPFHLSRAIYLGRSKGIEVSGFAAQAVSPSYSRTVYVREYLARVKMQLDLIFGKEPRFYGEAIPIG